MDEGTHQLLEHAVVDVEPQRGLDDVKGRARQRHARGRLLAGITAAIVAIVGVGGVIAILNDGRPNPYIGVSPSPPDNSQEAAALRAKIEKTRLKLEALNVRVSGDLHRLLVAKQNGALLGAQRISARLQVERAEVAQLETLMRHLMDRLHRLLVAPSGSPSATPVGTGISAGAAWSLVAIVGSQGASVLELQRADSGEVVAAVTSDGSDVPVVSGYAFGEGEPTDAVVFGLVSPETTSVTLDPGSGLPKEDGETVPVLGASMRAFVLTAYVPNGIVRAKDSSGRAIADELLVLPGEEPVVKLVEQFLSARIEGSGAEAFVASSALREFGPRLELQPLYATRDGRPYTGFTVLFISAGGDPYSVGVRLTVDGRQPVEETLGVGRAVSPDGEERLLVNGGIPGLTGP
jgi:hypothetical protein